MTYPTIEMYDISCTTTRAPWSPFTARTYLALRVLDMPFHRTMVPMVGIRSLLSSAGVSPNSDGDLLLPAITLTSDGTTRWLNESDDIAAHLQELFVAAGNPVSKSLFPDEDAREAGKAARKALRESLYSAEHAWKSLIPAVLDILEPESQQWFVDTRTKSWGKHPRDILTQDAPLNEERAGGTVQLLANALRPFSKLYDDKKLWIGGEDPVYADLIVVAALQWYSCARPQELKQAIEITGGGLEKAWIAAQPLLNE